MKKIICFIACAFNNIEIDLLYENVIKVALDSLNIKHFRVDKLNHNDNIDLKIIELINKADFGITDLTLARPSVYFEAGYLEGQKKPVIYLARKDHFQPIRNDLFGNFKIHFDLITRNIIIWDKLDDELIDIIKKRILLVINPIRLKILEKENNKNQIRLFKSLSIIDRIQLLNELTIKFITEKFKVVDIKLRNQYGIICEVNIKGEIKYFFFIIKETFSKRNIKEYHPAGLGFEIIIPRYIKNPFLEKTVIFISLRAIRNSTIESALYWCKKHSEDFYENTELSIPVKYLVIDNIENEAQYLLRLKNSIDKI